jgi:predicted GNAT superfamily acetyltransferase
MGIHLSLVKDVEGCEHFRALQRRVWGGADDDMVPNHVTVTVLKNGGALLGAYADDGPAESGGMVGAAFWWIGLERGRLKVCSHMAGVLPEWQGRRVGLLLKLRQRELVLAQGLTDWITWTYDPLQRVNGVFNIHRLGATCQTYFRNTYGIMNDALNAGTPSDRFQVDWHLQSDRVVRLVEGERPTPVNTYFHRLLTTQTTQGLLQPVETTLPLDGNSIAVPIPAEINQIRQLDSGLGLTWRLYTRQVFEAAFGAGYCVTDCIHLPPYGWHYLLTAIISERRS